MERKKAAEGDRRPCLALMVRWGSVKEESEQAMTKWVRGSNRTWALRRESAWQP